MGADLALETVTMERDQRLSQPFWRGIPGAPDFCEERKVGLKTSEVGVSRARWPLLFSQTVLFCERDNDPILLIKKDEFVEVSRLAAHPADL